jgi:glycosyltransferase involved in cell wall biosynthesis
MGHEILVYTMRHYGTPPSPYKGMRIKTIPALPLTSAEKMTSSLLAILDTAFRERPDLVHFHSFTYQFPFIPRWAGIPVLVQGHGLEWKRSRWSPWGRAILKLSELLCVRSASKLTVVSEVQRAYLEKQYGLPSVVIPTGVNPARRREASRIGALWGLEARGYLLFAGRLVPEKGVHTLIEAFRGLGTGLKLVIAGAADQERAYGERLKAMADGDPRIVLAGYVTGEAYEELMSNAYAFVLPSELEGLPTVLLEALSYGNCCMASDIPENREALGGKGIVFRNGSAQDLREKLEALLGDEGEAQRQRQAAGEGLLESHSWDGIAQRFHELYGSMAAKGKP